MNDNHEIRRVSITSFVEPDVWQSIQRELEFSDRQIEVARWLFAGRTRVQIAAELAISVETVRSHIDRLYAKVGVRKRSEFLERLHDRLYALRKEYAVR